MNPERLSRAWSDWSAPDGWPRVTTIDAHTEGEPLRVILGGFPTLEGATIPERRREARERHDGLRKALMWEPRGHADQYGCIVTPPVTTAADFGVLFTHNAGFSTMCGHGIIAVSRVVVDLGLVDAVEPVTEIGIDTPAGFVWSYVRIESGTVRSVAFRNVPSWAHALDCTVDVPGYGSVRYDLGFGGAYYAYVDAADLGLGLTAPDHDTLVTAGRAIKEAVAESHVFEHPTAADLGFVYGTIFIGPAENPAHHSRNVCIFADGEVDRSPTGTGVSGRLAIHHARGEIETNEPIVIESILGTHFTGRVLEETRFGPFDAIVPEVEGRAFLTGRHEFVIDPDDPLAEGFVLR